MVAPINTNTPGPGALNTRQTASADVRADGVDSLSSPALNIPNGGENYHWFMPDISGSRLTISPSNSTQQHISADTGINNIVGRILSHIGA